MTTQFAYCAAWESHQADHGDDATRIAFDRIYKGCMTLGLPETWCHQMSGWIDTQAQPSEQYRQILITVRTWCRDAKLPREPYYSMGCNSVPREPTEQDAFDLFRSQYKQKFPERRINSKHAKEQWVKVSEKAWQIAQDQYKTELAHYNAMEEKRNAENAKRRQEWIDEIHAMALIEHHVESLADAT